jgi:hypothetical protein
MLNNIFLDLQKTFNTRKAPEIGITPQGRSFTCKDLQAVKIKCSKDDAKVHKLAHLFRANGISLKKVYVRRSGSACESYLPTFSSDTISYLFTLSSLYVPVLFAGGCKLHTVLSCCPWKAKCFYVHLICFFIITILEKLIIVYVHNCILICLIPCHYSVKLEVYFANLNVLCCTSS